MTDGSVTNGSVTNGSVTTDVAHVTADARLHSGAGGAVGGTLVR